MMRIIIITITRRTPLFASFFSELRGTDFLELDQAINSQDDAVFIAKSDDGNRYELEIMNSEFAAKLINKFPYIVLNNFCLIENDHGDYSNLVTKENGILIKDANRLRLQSKLQLISNRR